MSVDATRWAWGVPVTSSTKRLVLLALADRAGEEHTCYPSAMRMVKDTNLNRKTVLAAINELISDGLIFDTGERKGNGVRVFKLIGVCGREGETYPKKATSPKIGTSTEIGISTSTEIGITTHPNIGIQNLKENLKENLTNKVIEKAEKQNDLIGEVMSLWVPDLGMLNAWLQRSGERPMTQDEVNLALLDINSHYEVQIKDGRATSSKMYSNFVRWIKRDDSRYKISASQKTKVPSVKELVEVKQPW